MLFADAEPFWKAPNVFDVATVLGAVLGIASIWLSWWLAKRDIGKRLAEAAEQAARAARDEVRRVARAVLHSGVTDAVRSLELAREACAGLRWTRAVDLCLAAREELARVTAQPAADDQLRGHLRDLAVLFQECVDRLRELKNGSGKMPEGVARSLDGAIITLRSVEGRMTGIRVEAGHVD